MRIERNQGGPGGLEGVAFSPILTLNAAFVRAFVKFRDSECRPLRHDSPSTRGPTNVRAGGTINEDVEICVCQRFSSGGQLVVSEREKRKMELPPRWVPDAPLSLCERCLTVDSFFISFFLHFFFSFFQTSPVVPFPLAPPCSFRRLSLFVAKNTR